jgi:Spy/CpxP family protein refolding chaperone
MKTNVKSLLIIVALAAAPLVVHAQDTTKPAAPAPAPAATAGGNRGNFNAEDFRKRMEERIKTSLKVTDEEWAVIQPLIEKVTDKQRDASTGRGFGGPGGTTRGGTTTGGTTGGTAAATTSTRPERAGTQEREALRLALDSDGASLEDIKAKLGAVRSVHQKATAELASAREDLKKVVTVRQEAVLVSMGILE